MSERDELKMPEREGQGERTGTGPVEVPAGSRILLAAGGTGGHITPAVALAEALHAMAPALQIQFCCGNRPAELQIYRRLRIRPWVLPVAHHRRGLVERGRFIGQMLAAWRRARRLLKKEPVRVAVGFGSYVSVTPLLAARLGGAKLILHEQNGYPGAANRLLAPFAKVLATAMPLSQKMLLAPPEQLVGNPVRKEIMRGADRAEARTFFRLSPDRLVLLCLGGSQGAVGINQMMLELIQRLRETEGPAGRWQLLWATGPTHFDRITKAVEGLGIAPSEHVINPYIDRMALAYAAADLVVARAGALTLAELTALGRPAVLVPLPTAAGNHQAINARRLAQTGAAEVIEEADPRAADKLEKLLEGWAQKPETLRAMGEAARAQGRPEAAQELARLVLDVLLNRT